jgi:hypothetical protein
MRASLACRRRYPGYRSFDKEARGVNGEGRKSEANQLLQRTGHANDGFSCFSASPRVSRLLTWIVGREEVMAACWDSA